ncbi:hypothetical protein BZG36_00309 [Bifiguratus adelaidae]|uniref:DNA-directed RNA polymerase III subunit RPC5 n=1 Tax=Bifiguratus adelaidae TaxID=1938954 RepID=A0A261Y7Z9_9FUNG|nr:hypothetical protein BZG36_00309 [Bifiguratus adelaidae]
MVQDTSLHATYGVDEDDEVIAEIPLYMSNRVANYLHIFQYPLRAVPFGPDSQPVAARIKPKAKMVELDLAFDTPSRNYDKDRGHELALGTNDKAIRTALDGMMDVDEEEEHDVLDRQTLGSEILPGNTKYMVGVFKDDEIHLTPVARIMQMRPTLRYLDKIDDKKRISERRIQEADTNEEPKEIPTKSTALQMSMKSNNPDAQPKENVYSSDHRFAEQEMWTKLHYFDETTDQSNAIFDQLFSASKDPVECTTTASQYLEKLSAP